MRPKSMILILIALGCGLVASIGISQVVERNSALNANKMVMKPIYVAMSNISAGEELSATRVKIEEWPADKIPEGAITKAEELDGMSPTQALYAGEPLLMAKLADRDKIQSSANKIPPGYRVTAIAVDATSAVAGLIWPGDHVDVLVFVGGRPKADVVLRNIEVFAVNDVVHREVDGQGNSIQARTVSLLVVPEQTEKLLHASSVGKLSLALRGPNETKDLGSQPDDFDPEKKRIEEEKNAIKQAAPPTPAFDPAELIRSVLGPMSGPVEPPKPKEPEFTMDIIEGGTGSIKKFEWGDRRGLPVMAADTIPSIPSLPSGMPSEISPEALGLGNLPVPPPPEPYAPTPTKESK